MGIRECGQQCHSHSVAVYDWFYDIFIVIRKNLRIRRRRYVALLLEIFTPIFIVTFLAAANSKKTLLRISGLHLVSQDDLMKNDPLVGFYDVGDHFDEEHLLRHNLCLQDTDPSYCKIGYVADDATARAIFQSPVIKTYFNETEFVRFQSEADLLFCLQGGQSETDSRCADFKKVPIDKADPVLAFRAAVVFQTSVNDLEIKYKIRLLEKYYGSLRHVMKTQRLYPSIYDRRQYGRSYLETGFLSLQLIIDRMIIMDMASKSTEKKAANVVFNGSITASCTCHVSMNEIPHRQSDQFHDPEDPLELTSDYEDDFANHGDTNTIESRHLDSFRINQVAKQSLIVSTVLVLSFTFLLPSEQRRIASEKENGLTILLLVTGMTHRMQWIGNLLGLTISYIFTITVVVFMLTHSFNHDEGAVFEFASFSILWLLFFMYVMALAAGVYCTTVFFDKPSTAITASVTFWVTTFVVSVYHIDYYYNIVPIWVTLFACLHPSIALQLALRLLIRFEKYGVRTNIFLLSRVIPTDPLRIIYIVLIFIGDIVLYMILTIYLDRILKSKYGVNKPWYYVFKSSEWRSTDAQVSPEMLASSNSATEHDGYEPCPQAAVPTVITTNLTKKYGKTVAVDDLNFQLYHGEIFALLGSNNSGKSTILKLFSGFTPPTSGDATICGHDLKTHMVQIQAFTGICPQYNWLYDDLTPYEHLLVFGRLRGLRGKDAGEEATELLEKLRILELANRTVRNLSRGDRRKVSLAIALIGDPKIILLDEPTGGLDYYSRRAVWDLLLKIRSNHTIIFSTHFMDEAELLGDRIGIMFNGKLEVCGSHAFLRRHFGLGYSLKISTDPHKKPEPEEILQVVRNSVPSASLSTLPISPNASRVCTCNIPVADYSTATMSALFTDLAGVKESIGIVGFSVSYASVDEIFLQLTRQLNPTAEVIIPIENREDEYHEEDREKNIERMFSAKRKRSLHLVHFGCLFWKRLSYIWRSKKTFWFQMILPCIVYISGSLRLSSHVEIGGRAGPPLELKLDVYKTKPVTLYHALTGETFISREVMEAVIGRSAKSTLNSDISGDYIHVDYSSLRNRHLVGISAETGSSGQMYVHFSPYFIHTAPLALNLYANALIKYLDPKRRITATNHPLQHPYFTGPNFEEDPYAPDIFFMMSTLSATTIVTFCVLFPLEERLNDSKHLQLMAGVHALTYWLAIFSLDVITVIIQALVFFTFSMAYAPTRVFTLEVSSDWTLFAATLVSFGFCYSSLMMAYFLSHFAHSKSGGFALLLSITLLFGVSLPFFIFGVGNPEANVSETLLWLFLLIPIYATASAQRKYAVTKIGNARCNHFTALGILEYCRTESIKEGKELRKVSCCPNCLDIPGSLHCYDKYNFSRLPWNIDEKHVLVRDQEESHNHAKLNASRNVFYEILFMFLVGFFFNCLVVFLDSDSWKYMKSCMSGERARAFQTNVEDDDILDEMDRVERMVDHKRTDNEAMVAHNLCKSYGSYPAVHNISFAVHPGESFGVIGVNGAGKSTLFRLLTGALAPTYGNVYSVDCSLSKKRCEWMRKIGFSPQHGDALFDYFTCSENIMLFGRLRGMSKKEAGETSTKLLKKMGLEQYENTRVTYLSGGTKRRLVTILAIVSEPPIIIFDEPTSSADPASRRSYWEVIKEAKTSGHTVLLSSHRIHECEDLCHRMVMLVDGKFQCIGSPAHLKEKFGNGFKLLVKLIPGPAESQAYVSSLSEAIVKRFNPCSLRDRRRNVIQYVIHNANVSWDYLFQMMEHIKLRYNDLVEDYAFSNTTLDEVFLSFVIHQNCGRIVDQSTGCCSFNAEHYVH